MTSDATIDRPRPFPWRLAWLIIPAILLLPWLGNWPWTRSDYVVMGLMLGSVGLGIEFLVRQSGSTAYRLGAVMAVIAAFLTVWVNLAVGMIGSEDNPYNLLFFAVLLAAALGGILVRLKARGMAMAMLVTAILQAAAGLAGMPADMRGGIFSTGFSGLWLLSAALFWAASRGGPATAD